MYYSQIYNPAKIHLGNETSPGDAMTVVIPHHYNDVIMNTMASQITILTIVYSTV